MENNNVFEGATFGDKFVTRDGSKLMFVHYLDDIDAYHCVLENWYETLDYAPNGKAFKLDNHPTDIISRYQEPITSKEIDEDKIILTKEELTQIKIREYDWGFEAGSSKDSEPIDEEKLCIDKCYATNKYIPIENEGGNNEIASIRRCSFSDGFELGYRKAMEG